jgi:hypothetical protein
MPVRLRENSRARPILLSSLIGFAIISLGVAYFSFQHQNEVEGSGKTLPVELYTAPHAEIAPFQRVWNPDTNNYYSSEDFSSDGSDGIENSDLDSPLCGLDGNNCPEIPAFGGEDYFNNKPIGQAPSN